MFHLHTFLVINLPNFWVTRKYFTQSSILRWDVQTYIQTIPNISILDSLKVSQVFGGYTLSSPYACERLLILLISTFLHLKDTTVIYERSADRFPFLKNMLIASAEGVWFRLTPWYRVNLIHFPPAVFLMEIPRASVCPIQENIQHHGTSLCFPRGRQFALGKWHRVMALLLALWSWF